MVDLAQVEQLLGVSDFYSLGVTDNVEKYRHSRSNRQINLTISGQEVTTMEWYWVVDPTPWWGYKESTKHSLATLTDLGDFLHDL